MASPSNPPPLDIAEDFGQRVDLTRRIREILTNYPEGTTVLKELIQNADDAGATEVSFCLDRRQHGADTLLYTELAACQGPALLAYNNAVFSAEDFESISKLGGSKKGRQPWKTGRFGIGFNSVYHLSDLPSFVSGRHVVYFDPHCRFLPNVSAVNPGKRIDFVKSGVLSYYKDQFLPYCMFGCDMKTSFEGTLFRFPLRTVTQASQSQLSRQHYDERDITQLFDELCEEASLCMLFLKNVETIKLYDWHPGLDSPCMLYSCSLASATPQIRWHRRALTRLANVWTSHLQGDTQMPKYLDSFVLDFYIEKVMGNENTEVMAESFMVVQCMDAPTSRVGALSLLASKEYGICLLPWGAVAAKISGDNMQVSCKIVNDGKAFCFLPLPLRTNLPIHVNGFFELSSNRRDIWQGADMEGMGKIRADWNSLLLNDVVTSAYHRLLLVVPDDHRLNYKFWPSGFFVEPWKTMVKSFFQGISKYPVFYSNIDGGRWLLLSEAILHDEGMANHEKQAAALITLRLPLVCVPKNLFQRVSTHCDAKILCPRILRQHLKNIGASHLHVEWESGLGFLHYCLGDVIDEDASADLSGVPLVPLTNGKFGVFGGRISRTSFFVCDEKQYILIEKLKDRIISRNIPQFLLQRMNQLARASSVNISFMSVLDFVNFLDEILPAEWKDKDVIQWMPRNNNDHPSEAWLITFWEYMRESCKDLTLLDSWPLLPINEGLLCRAKKDLGIIRGDGSWSKELEKTLTNVGCHIMRCDLCAGHTSLSKCVQSPTAMGILDAIACVALSTGHTYKDMFSRIISEHRRELRSFLLNARWYSESLMKESHLQIIKSLPIFEVHGTCNSKEEEFVDLLNRKRYLSPSNVDDFLMDSDFLCTQSQVEIEVLRKALSIQQLERSTFFKVTVIDKIADLTDDVRDKAMLTILKELPLLCLHDPHFKNTLMNVSFVPTLSGELRSPRLLYDPRIEEFQILLNEKESFPSETFRTDDVLDALQLLGLQTSVSPDTVLHSARQVELLLKETPDEASARGYVLLSYLEVNAVKLFHSSVVDGINSMFLKVTDMFQTRRTDTDLAKNFWSELASVCWCPVLVQSPHPGLPWPSVTTPLAPPKLVRLPADLWLASASMRILNGDCRSSFLSEKLGWTSHLGGNVLAAQLLELGRIRAYADSQGLKQALAAVIPKMYALLTEKLGTEELEIVKTILEGSHWVWVGDKFVSVNEVVLNGPLHLAPYLWVIPADLAVFKELLLELGVKESLAVQDFAAVLGKMFSVKTNTPLDSAELKTVIWVLQHLADSGFGERGETLFVPDTSGILLPSSELAYNDAPWLLGDFQESGVTLDVMIGNRSLPRFVHANISNDVAEKLSIKSLRRLLLAESADSLDVTLHGAAEAFGQHEALTTRLKHIVDMYVDGPGILCELLQNSDDAGASEVSFLLDNSQFGSSSLLAPRMSDWQGPALYCFNNSVFTSKDLHAISRIGQDSKLDKPHAVGRFGLGFNSVYHFTDVPGFVSGSNLVIFDPHACHLPGISPSHPGLKINYVGKGLAQQFPDQCHPYMLFGCDLQHNYDGTLFRFPLRTSLTAARSQIKQSAYNPKMVLSLLRDFQLIASEVLLFLHNVTSLRVYVREGLDQEMHMLYKVSKQGTAYKNPVYTFVRTLKEQSQDKKDFYQRLHGIPKDQLPSDCHLVSITTEEVERQSTQVWTVSNYLGGKEAVNMATSLDNQIHGFVPWAGIAAKIGGEVISNKSGSLTEVEPDLKSASLEGRAFCFLPLPVKTSLPVHVNAYFELSSNRRDIWFGDDMAGGGKLRSEWNCCLLKEVASPAYVRMLAHAASQLGSLEEFYSLWPTGMLSEPWATLLRGVFVSAVELDMPILFTPAKGGQWIPPRKAVFPDYSYPRATELGNALADAGLSLVNTPASVVDQFRKYCPTLRYLAPQLLRSLMIRRQRALNNRDAMLTALRYCLYDIKTVESIYKLEGLPLIPLAAGMFETFTCSSVSDKVFVADEVEFDLLKDTNLNRLVDHNVDPELFKELHAIAEFQSTNVALLSPVLLRDLLPSILPQDWYGKRLVHWTCSESGHPSEAWIELLWTYLCSRSADLSLFTKWPLLPTEGEHHLLQLSKGSCILVGDSWSENMVSLLKKANCFLLNSSFRIDHPQLGEYVHDVSASGLLGALFAAAGGFKGLQDVLKDVSDLEMQELRGFLMQRKWFKEDAMGAVQIEILKHLPIFKSYRTSTFVCLAKGLHYLPLKEADIHLLGDEFVRAESDKEEEILTGYLGVKKLGKKDFFENFAFKHFGSIPPGVQEKVILNLFQDFSSLKEEVPCIKSVLSHLAIVPTKHGGLKCPKELYDPRVPDLQTLVDDSFFPSIEFSEAKFLEVLIELGLKTSLGLEDLLDSATSVASVSSVDEQRALTMGKFLLAHINKLGLNLEVQPASGMVIAEDGLNSQSSPLQKENESMGEEKVYFGDHTKIFESNHDASDQGIDRQFWTNLRSIKWCPALIEAPVLNLPWPKELKSSLVPPRFVRPKSHMWHVSATMRILDGEFSSRLMMSRLGWLEKPNFSILAVQLIELSKHHAEVSECLLKFNMEETDTGVTQLNKTLDGVISSLYSLMEESLSSESIFSLKSMLEGICWVWVGDAFVLPTQAAFILPSHFQPYLHVIPGNLAVYRGLLSALGVKETFDIVDFASILQQVSQDRKGAALNKELLDFVVRVLEAIDEILVVGDAVPNQSFLSAILVPDSNGFLMPAKDLIYNDAPWLAQNVIGLTEIKCFVHPDVPNELADRLGAKSLRYLSFVDKEMTKDLPCLSSDEILNMLSIYGQKSNLLFDLLEIADKCRAQKVHVVYDKRVHAQTSILQPNLGQFQGAALTIAFEGAELTTEEVCNLQLSPSWSRRGQNINYGAGLLSCYTITNLLLLVSKGCLYLFDPSGSILAPSFTNGKSSSTLPAQGKVYTLEGTDIPQRFADQFTPLRINENLYWGKPNVTIVRMPLYTDAALSEEGKGFRNQRSEDVLDGILKDFMCHAPTSLLFLNSVEAVHLSEWGSEDSGPVEFFSVKVDAASVALRNPFVGKNPKKFQLSTIFNSSSSVTKMNTIDVFINKDGNCIMDKWLVVLSFGCGQTKTLALDRRFLSYNLSPVAGVAVLVSRNGSLPSHPVKSTILCPLPLAVDCRLPVAILGCFFVLHDGFRHLFSNSSAFEFPAKSQQSILPIHSMWNQELMACVRESYIQLLSESIFAKQEISSRSVYNGNSQVPTATWKMLSKQPYGLWPMSQKLRASSSKLTEESNMDASERGWLVKLVVRPMIVRLAELPVWKLHGGSLVRATEGMFLSNPNTDQHKLQPPDAVCEFLKEHYKVFAVPCELTKELQDAQVNIKVITPRMVRYLMCTLPAVLKFSDVDRYIELLEYSCADYGVVCEENQARPESSSTIDAIHEDSEFDSSGVQLPLGEELTLLRNRSSTESQAAGRDTSDRVTNIWRAISHLGKVVEDLSIEASQKLAVQKQTSEVSSHRSSASNFERWISEVKGLPCLTAANSVIRLGKTEALLGSAEEQKLLLPLAAKFIHIKCLDRPILLEIFKNTSVQQALDIKPFTAKMLSDNMALVLPRQWNRRLTQWVEWDLHIDARIHPLTVEWLRLFWKHVDVSTEELLLFQQWPLVPAVLGSSLLVKLQYRHLIFLPPIMENTQHIRELNIENQGSHAENLDISSVLKSYTEVQEIYPWLFPFLQHCKVPIFDQNFLDCEVVKTCLPTEAQTLCQIIRTKLLAAKDSGNLVVSEMNMVSSDCDALFSLFANEFFSVPSAAPTCSSVELELMRSLPIHKTTIGTYTSVDPFVHSIVIPTAFFKPQSDFCLQHFPLEQGGAYYKALGIQELSNSDTLVKFCFPFFGVLSIEDQEQTLSHVYTQWENLQHNESVVNAMMNTRFVSNGDKNNDTLFQPRELLDPTVPLFKEVFGEKSSRFPDANFITNKWLDILRKAGLHSTLDAEALLDCAREVENMGRWGSFATVGSEDFKEVSTEVFATAGHVVETILANYASLYGSSFFEPLSEIAFVPTEMGLPFRNETDGRRVLASYKQLVLLKDWPLAWTCAPILTEASLMPPEFSWHSLHLKSPPHFHTVLRHIQNVGEHNGEDILARWPSADDMMTVEDAFLEILKYLEKHWESLSSQDKLILQKVPFIPISNGTRLCLASRIFLRLEMNLAPFVFQLPNCYLPYVNLLTNLGMKESPTLSGMQDFLYQVQNACGYQRLNPNELCAVMKILDFMCKNILNGNQHQLLEHDTVVPDDAGRLLHARACVYIDAPASAMVSKIDTSRLRFVHPFLRVDYCICLGVQKLSEVVVEVLDDSVPLEFTSHFGNITKDVIVQKLTSESFQSAVWTLLQDFSKEMPNLKPLARHEVARKLLWSAENLECVKHLKTRFLIVNGNVDITKHKKNGADSVSEVDHLNHVYIDKKTQRILLAVPPVFPMTSEILSVMVSKVLDSPACLPFSGLFNSSVGTEFLYVGIMRLRPYQHQEMKSMLDNHQGIVPGDELSTSDAAQVQVHPLRPYYSGEIVAWCADFAPDTKLKYGIIVEDVRAPSGQAIYYLQVETAPGKMQSLLSSNVFSFKSVVIGTELHVSPRKQLLLSSASSEAGISARAESMHQSLDQGNSKSFSKNVHAAAVVNAVNDMMSAVGFPLGLDQRTLLSQALTLQEHLTATQVALSSEKERADEVAKEAETARASWLCRICLSLEVNCVLVPCGHVLCRNCGSVVARCPFCRQPVTKSVNLYRP